MKRTICRYLGFIALFLLAFAGAAFAGVFGTIKDWLTGQALDGIMSVAALGITGLLGYLHKLNAARMDKITTTLTETGNFLTTVGTAAGDQNVTREELAAIIKQGALVVTVALPTPANYAVNSDNVPKAPDKH